MNKLLRLFMIFAFCGGGAPSYADSTYSDFEMMSLPSWCKLAFQNSSYNSKIALSKSRSASNAGQPSNSISNPVIPGGHHTCAGIAELNRAKRGMGTYSMAIKEFNYSYALMDTTHPQLSYVASYLGKALYLSGRKNEASEVWLDAISAQPTRRESYLAFADVLMKERRNERALEILLKYDEQKESEAPDAEQYLAQVYFNLKQYDKALAHAENAQRLGYPFLGLLKKLRLISEKK